MEFATLPDAILPPVDPLIRGMNYIFMSCLQKACHKFITASATRNDSCLLAATACTAAIRF